MKLKLNENWTKKLLKYPESGMGYQKVNVLLKSGQVIKNVIVLNAEDLVLPDQYENLRIDEITDLIVMSKNKP
jgi:hypothetical protein